MVGVVPASVLEVPSLQVVLLLVVGAGLGPLVLCKLGQGTHIHLVLLAHVLAFHGLFAGHSLGGAAVEVGAPCCKVLQMA